VGKLAQTRCLRRSLCVQPNVIQFRIESMLYDLNKEIV
jgi:hypothetical protein